MGLDVGRSYYSMLDILSRPVQPVSRSFLCGDMPSSGFLCAL